MLCITFTFLDGFRKDKVGILDMLTDMALKSLLNDIFSKYSKFQLETQLS